MQLKERQAGDVRKRIARLSAGLLAASLAGHPKSAAAQYDESENNNFGPGIAYSQLDAALLVYQEAGGRVSATEPTLDLSVHGADGRQLSLGFVADAVSGATPNGAVPSNLPQNFVTPLRASGSSVTVSGASGGSTIIHLPSTPGQIAQAALGRQYTVPANTLPVDKGFRDHRGAFNFGWAQPLGGISEVGFGGSYSRESDYQAVTSNAHISRNLNSDNTTLSFSVNGEFDSSFPFGGIPVPLSVMNAQWKSPTSRNKTQLGFVAGWTEVMSRWWLMQLNYAFDGQSGYQNDPYRIISVVNPSGGEPVSSLYENRPLHRQGQSLFWDNKIDLNPAVTEFSFRYYTDNWNITSKTAEISEHVPLGDAFYVEPSGRWYQQSAASFFHYFLVGGQALPQYASSDMRLGAFTGLTYGAKIGYHINGRSEFYLKGEYYEQMGNHHPANAIGQLQQQDLFSGTNAAVIFAGYSWDFH